MMYPILCRVQFESLHRSFGEKRLWVQLGVSVGLNWVVAPILMVSCIFPILFKQL